MLQAAFLCVGYVSSAAGSPEQSEPARLWQLVDELLFHILGADPRLFVSSKSYTTRSLSSVQNTHSLLWNGFVGLHTHTHFHKIDISCFELVVYIEFSFHRTELLNYLYINMTLLCLWTFTIEHNNARRKENRRHTTCGLMHTFYNVNHLCCVPEPLPVCCRK